MTNRGLAYGDGLFETIGIRNHRPTLWQEHYQRLSKGGEVLGIKVPEAALLQRELLKVAGQHPSVVGKVLLTRGEGGRGYLAPLDVEPVRVVMAYPWPETPASWFKKGVRVRLCRQRVSEQRGLAGLKHLNRLDCVLARSEWRSSRIAEGLMFDSHDNVIEGTSSNLIAVLDNQLVTPDLGSAGVAGAMRAWLMANYRVREVQLHRRDLSRIQSAAMCNSVYGLWPIRSIDTIGSLDVAIIASMIKHLPWDQS